MKNLLLVVLLFLTFCMNAQTTKESGFYYCVQVLSTENPQLLKPDTFIDLSTEPYVESFLVGRHKWYRIIFIYNSIQEQEEALKKWSQHFEDTIKVTKNESQIQKMILLFENL
jgi:hypothetical protein